VNVYDGMAAGTDRIKAILITASEARAEADATITVTETGGGGGGGGGEDDPRRIAVTTVCATQKQSRATRATSSAPRTRCMP